MSLPPVATTEWPRLARYAAIVALAVLAVAAVLFLRPIATIIVTGAIIAVVTGRAAVWLVNRTRLRPVTAIILVYVIFMVAIILLALTVFPWAARALEVLIAALRAEGVSSPRAAEAGAAIGQRLELFFTTAQIQRLAETVVAWTIRLLSAVLGGVARGVYVLALGIFLSLLIHLDLGGRGLRPLDRLPSAHARELRHLWRELLPLWTRFVGASVLFAVIIAVASFIEFIILGVPYPALMALLTGLITPIPSVGGILSSIVVAVPCLVFGSTRFPDMDPLAFAALVWVINSIITQGAYNFVLMPVLGKAVRLPVSVVLIGVLASFALNSILFAFLVVPVLASLRIVAEYLYAKAQRREPFPDAPAAT